MDALETSCFGVSIALVGSVFMIWGVYICSTGNLLGVVKLVIGILAIFYGTNILHRAIFKLRTGNTARQGITVFQRFPVSAEQVVIVQTRDRKPLPQIPISESNSRNSTERESSSMKEQRSLPPIPQVAKDDLTKGFAEQKKNRPLPPTPEVILSFNSDIAKQNINEIIIQKLDSAPKSDICIDREEKSLSIVVKQSNRFRSNTTQHSQETKCSLPDSKSCPIKFGVCQEEPEISQPIHIIKVQTRTAKNSESELPESKGKHLVPIGSVSKLMSSKVPENLNKAKPSNPPFYEEVIETPLLKKANFKTSFANRVIDRVNTDKV